jgi:crotonobetainyl-CoA:carnitine CoA-transferase CaiB-like acyl-CoA transferase
VDVAELLASLRVLDLSGDDGDAVTRLLADLGADVLKVEPPGGSPSRTLPPTLHGASVRFALHNANKRSTVLDPADPDARTRLVELAGSADIVVDSGNPGQAAAYGTSCADLADRYPQLVALSITDFGDCGPRTSWQATDPCYRRTVSHRPLPLSKPHGPRWLRTTTGYVVAQGITSTLPGSTRS